MPALDELFSDPRIAIGYGLLASRENPMGAAMGIMERGQQMQQQKAENAIRQKVLQRQMESLDIQRAAEERKQRMQDMLMGGIGGEMSPEAWQMYGITGGNTAAYQYGKDLQERQRNEAASQGVRDVMGVGQPQGYTGFALPRLDESKGAFMEGIGTQEKAPMPAQDQPEPDPQSRIDALMQKRQELSLLRKSEQQQLAIQQIDKQVELLQKQIPSASDIRQKEKLDFENKQLQTKALAGLRGFEQQTKLVTDTIDKALQSISPFSTGYGFAALSELPNTEARKLKGYLDTIKANIGFDRLQQMRDNSPTGGALGQVSEMENRLLQATQGALDPMQSELLEENLKIIRQSYPLVLQEKRKAYESDFGKITNDAQSGDATMNDLRQMSDDELLKQLGL